MQITEIYKVFIIFLFKILSYFTKLSNHINNFYFETNYNFVLKYLIENGQHNIKILHLIRNQNVY